MPTATERAIHKHAMRLRQWPDRCLATLALGPEIGINESVDRRLQQHGSMRKLHNRVQNVNSSRASVMPLARSSASHFAQAATSHNSKWLPMPSTMTRSEEHTSELQS